MCKIFGDATAPPSGRNHCNRYFFFRQEPHRFGSPGHPGRRTTSVILSLKGGPSPAAIFLLSLRAEATQDQISAFAVTWSAKPPHHYANPLPTAHHIPQAAASTVQSCQADI